MRSHNYFIFLLLSFFAYVNSANAVTVQSFNGPVTLNRDGTCTASGLATETRFDLTGTALSVLDTVNDGGGNDFYDVYLVDGAGTILFASTGVVNTGPAFFNGTFNVSVNPASGPFTFRVTENTAVAPTVQAQGATFSQTALATLSFDANALDSDCPGAGGQLTSGAISAATASKVFIQALSNGISLNGLLSLSKHLSRITVGGLGGFGNFNQGGLNNIAAKNQLVVANFKSSTSSPYSNDFERKEDESNNAFVTSDGRDVARVLLPFLEFDTSDGITMPAFLKNDSALNASEDEVLNRPGGLPDTIGTSKLPFSAWLDTNYSVVENDFSQTGNDQRFDGDILSVSTGFDYWVNDQLLLGTFFSYSNAELDTTFNSGEYDENAYTISPYILYKATENFSVNASLGYTFSDIDQVQSLTTTPVSSSTNANTFYGTIEGQYKYDLENSPIQLVASTGYRRSRRKVDSFTDSGSTFNAAQTANSSQAKIGGEVRYNLVSEAYSFQPFVKLDLLYEFMNLINNDPMSANVVSGMRYYNSVSNLSLSIEGNALVGQNDFNQYGISGTISKGFTTNLFGGGQFMPTANISTDYSFLNSTLGIVFENDKRNLKFGLVSGLRTNQFYENIDTVSDKYINLNADWEF